jgi:Zn-finger nucleic acid-binding protein
MIFQGAKYCSHCGAKVDRTELPADRKLKCPRCRTALDSVRVGTSDLLECGHCEGIWADADTLSQICANREQQAAVLGMAGVANASSHAVDIEQVRYVPCPVCNQLMNRVNFAHCSNVVVDVCKTHGTWFDKDELRGIVEFIEAGGIEKSRERQIAELTEQQIKTRAEIEASRAMDAFNPPVPRNYTLLDTAVSAAADVLTDWMMK